MRLPASRAAAGAPVLRRPPQAGTGIPPCAPLGSRSARGCMPERQRHVSGQDALYPRPEGRGFTSASIKHDAPGSDGRGKALPGTRIEQILKRSEGAVAATLLVAQGSVLIWANNRQFTFRLSPKCGGRESRVVGSGEIEGWVDCSHRHAGTPIIPQVQNFLPTSTLRRTRRNSTRLRSANAPPNRRRYAPARRRHSTAEYQGPRAR